MDITTIDLMMKVSKSPNCVSSSILRVTTYYLSLGYEWISSSGAFVNLGLTYVRSLDIEAIWELEDARSGNLSLENYGKFDYLKTTNSVQDVNVSISLGFSF